MKRLLFLILSTFFLAVPSLANHITGGEMFYTLTSVSGNIYRYHLTLKLYRDCNAPPGSAQLDPTAAIAIFPVNVRVPYVSKSVPISKIVILNLGSPSACITNPPPVCYQVGYYEWDVDLPASPNGYIATFQRCCRIAGINNLTGSNSVGTSYTAEIPGTNLLATAPSNNSARFIGADTVVVCANNAFSYSFAAVDEDGDALSYSFCNAYRGGSTGNAAPDPPEGPPYSSVPYAAPYNGGGPLGNDISINTSTGLLSGTAPSSGIYVVTVCVTERRNGILIATQRKDLQIKIGNCNIARAALNPEYITCDGFTLSFKNLNNSPLINTFFWDFGVSGVTTDTSNAVIPTFTYPDTGVYTLKLVTNRNQECSDSTTAIVKVYPGFFPGFSVRGACFSNPFIFTDTTNTRYGVVDSWTWNFGDPSTIDDESTLQNPTWTYADQGTRQVTFVVTNSKGCKDTVQKSITVIDKPPINLAFRDTLICVPDNLQLNASGFGAFSWTPNISITNANTATPTVNPTSSTTYYVDLNDDGCLNRDSVRVRVVTFVTLNANKDTTICLGDPLTLGAATDGLLFDWTPAANLNDPTLLAPIAVPNTTTTYQITAHIGSCSATDDIVVTTIPYPVASAGGDTIVCYNTSAQLHGIHDGSSFTWTPTAHLNNPNILDPLASPPQTLSYILSSFDVLGCPKPGRDTVTVTVLPKVQAFAGRDTSVIVGQPMQFEGSGGINYVWSPSTGLDNINIPDPVGIYTSEIDSIRYRLLVTDQAGCVDSAFILVKVFKTAPYVFVPTGFTPNNDRKNDLVRPIAVGIKRINYFRIYNRWGELVFSTKTNGQGWDGTIGGRLQATNTYVWMVSATDYLDRPYFQKGTVTLIR